MRVKVTDKVNYRANKRVEAAVERGLVAALLSGVSAGALAMVEEGVPLDVAARVLLRPEHRRVMGWRQ